MSGVGEHRLDRWLWFARFFKTRSLATQAIEGGKVHLNDARVKPGHRVRVGDRVSLDMQGVTADFDIVGLPLRRGPATEAQEQYVETAASRTRRQQFREQHRLAQLTRPRPEVRPDKRDRRLIMKLQREQG